MDFQAKTIEMIDDLLSKDLSDVLINQLSNYRKAIEEANSISGLNYANRVFGRFVIDSFGWDNPLYEVLSEIHGMGVKFEKEKARS